jgi:uncharacterized protein
MLLEGVVTNVANFGAFIDVGVHQDGLVHVSQLASRFVKDPREVVRAGEVVRVKVVEIDVKRRRIALTMKLHEPVPVGRALGSPENAPAAREPRDPTRREKAPPGPGTSMSAAFARSKPGADTPRQ